MHLLPVYYNTNASGKKKKKKIAPTVEHQKFLSKMGVNKEALQNRPKQDKNWKKGYKESLAVDRDGYVSAGMSGDASSCVDRSILTNLHKEPEHVQKEIMHKASRAMPLFNKGGYQFLTDGMDPTTVGSKSRRG